MLETIAVSYPSLKGGWKTFADSVCNALTERVAQFLKNNTGADLIIVVGPTGVGKSSIIQAITGHDVYVASTLNSGTRHTALAPAAIEGRRYLFLDIPGFDAHDLNDFHIFTMLMTAMATICPYVTFRGVIYVDALINDRLTPSAQKILTWLQHFCGTQFMSNVTIVTTKWDGLNEDGIQDKLKRFRTWIEGPLEPLHVHGASFYHHGLIRDEDTWKTLHIKRKDVERASRAKQMIHERYYKPTSLSLQIYDEIASGHSIETTSAGRWLRTGSLPPSPDSIPFGAPDTANQDRPEPARESSQSSSPPRQVICIHDCCFDGPATRYHFCIQCFEVQSALVRGRDLNVGGWVSCGTLGCRTRRGCGAGESG